MNKKKFIVFKKARIEDSRKVLDRVALRISATLKDTVAFKEVEVKDAKTILKWRREKRISKFQFTDIGSSLEKQKNWIKSTFFIDGTLDRTTFREITYF